jgi:hypothetical protein
MFKDIFEEQRKKLQNYFGVGKPGLGTFGQQTSNVLKPIVNKNIQNYQKAGRYLQPQNVVKRNVQNYQQVARPVQQFAQRQIQRPIIQANLRPIQTLKRGYQSQPRMEEMPAIQAMHGVNPYLQLQREDKLYNKITNWRPQNKVLNVASNFLLGSPEENQKKKEAFRAINIKSETPEQRKLAQSGSADQILWGIGGGTKSVNTIDQAAKTIAKSKSAVIIGDVLKKTLGIESNKVGKSLIKDLISESDPKKVKNIVNLLKPASQKAQTIIPKATDALSNEARKTTMSLDELKGIGTDTGARHDDIERAYQAVKNGTMQPIDVGRHPDRSLWLRDGSHRLSAMRAGKIDNVPVVDNPLNLDVSTPERLKNLITVNKEYNEYLHRMKTSSSYEPMSYEKYLQFRGIKSSQHLSPQSTQGATAEIKRVADNIQKNNTGVPRPDAEAMAKDVVSNRGIKPQLTTKTATDGVVAPSETKLLTGSTQPLTPQQAKRVFKKTGVAPEFVNIQKPNEKPIPVIFGDFATRTTEGGKVKPIGNYNAGQFVPRDIQEAVLKGKDRSVLKLLRESPIRNVEDVFGTDGGAKINDYLVRPVAENETKRVNWITQEIQQIKDNVVAKVGKKNGLNDQLAFDYAEGKLNLNDLKNQTKDWQKVKEAADFGRAKYDEWLKMINGTLEKYGYEPIKARKDYVTHIQQIDGFFNQFGSLMNMDKDKLPTVMSSIHTSTRPGKKWFSFAQPRKGGEYDKSLIGAIEAYLPKASEQIYHTDSIQRARLLQKTIEGSVTDIADRQLSNFNSWLGQYANKLSGKTSELDRSFEKTLGRGVLRASSWAKSRVGSNMVGANISSALTNFIPLTQSIATTSKPQALRGVLEAVISPFTKPGTVDGIESGFLTRRFKDNKIYQTVGQKVGEDVNALFRGIDRFTSESVVRGKYYEGLKQGLTKFQAMKAADEYAGRVITDRSMGQMPILFDSKALGLFTQFQAEVNNQLSFIFKDIPKISKNPAHLASMLTQVAIYSYLYNQMFENATGRRPALDPIGVIQDAYEDYSSGNKKATTNLITKISDQLPFISTFTGGGRIPLSAAFPDVMGMINGTTDWKKEAIKPLTYIVPPTGGGQIKKSYEGIKAYMQGASTTGKGMVRYPIEQTKGNLARTALFGQYATKEAQNYFRTGQTALSKGQSDIYRTVGDKTDYYKSVLTERAKNKEIDKIKEGNGGTTSDGTIVKKIGKEWKTFDTEQEANFEIAKDTFKKSGKNIQEYEDKVFRLQSDGDVKVQTKDEYDYAVGTNKLQRLKANEDYKGWMETANKQLEILDKQLKDPTLDELEQSELIEKADKILSDMEKYQGYGGFKKGKKTKTSSLTGISNLTGGIKIPIRTAKKPTFNNISATPKIAIKTTKPKLISKATLAKI